MLSLIVAFKPRAARDPAIIEAIGKDYRRLRRDALGGLNRLDIDDLHDLRKRANTHRHHMALLATFSGLEDPKRVVKRAERARKLHEHIGHHRDHHLLSEYLRGLGDPKTAGIRDDLLQRIKKKQAKLLKKAMKIERKLDRPKPRAIVAMASGRQA